MAATQQQPPAETGESDLSSRYILALVIEVVVLSTLYWLGVHFG